MKVIGRSLESRDKLPGNFGRENEKKSSLDCDGEKNLFCVLISANNLLMTMVRHLKAQKQITNIISLNFSSFIIPLLSIITLLFIL